MEGGWLKFLLNEVTLKDTEIAYAERRLKRGGIFEQVCAHEMAALQRQILAGILQKGFCFRSSNLPKDAF